MSPASADSHVVLVAGAVAGAVADAVAALDVGQLSPPPVVSAAAASFDDSADAAVAGIGSGFAPHAYVPPQRIVVQGRR